MKYAKLLIVSILFLFLNLKIISANEISNRHLYYIGDEINFSIETKLPNKSKYVSKSRLIDIKMVKKYGMLKIVPRQIKRIYDRETGNWIASYKDGNEIARAIPHNGGLKFPLNKGDQWSQSWTFTAAGGLVTGKSEAEYKVKRETVKANNKKYKTLKIEMKNPYGIPKRIKTGRKKQDG